jgi:fatty acid desaturase
VNPPNRQSDERADVSGLALLIVFAVAAIVVTAAVWALGVFSGWWLLVPVVLVYLLAAGGVMWAVWHTMSSPDDPGDGRPLPH